MKTTIQAPTPKGYSNAYGFKITIEGNQLPQPCHPEGYFSVTAEIYHKATRSRTGDGTRACGCLHDDILRVFPSLAFLISMHSADAVTGELSGAEGNGFYRLAGACPEVSHFWQEFHAGNSKQNFPATPPPDKPWENYEYRLPTADECLQSLADHLRCPVEEAHAIKARCLAAWNSAPSVPVVVPYPLNTKEHREAMRKAEKEQHATPNPTTEDPLTRLFATINRRSEQQRKHHEDQKLAALRRKPWWLDADNHEPDTYTP